MAQRIHPKVVLLLGAPGTGKGTQTAYLSAQLDMVALSTGEMLRREAMKNNPSGFRLRQLLATGSLVPDELVCDAVAARLRHAFPPNGVVLDGFPRTVGQAEFLDGLLDELGLAQPTVIHLQVAEDALLKRLTSRRQCAKCGAIYNLISCPSKRGRLCEIDSAALVQRDDDSEGVILRRFAEYEAMSLPLVDYYAGENYIALDGARDPQEIASDVMDAICVSAMAA